MSLRTLCGHMLYLNPILSWSLRKKKQVTYLQFPKEENQISRKTPENKLCLKNQIRLRLCLHCTLSTIKMLKDFSVKS